MKTTTEVAKLLGLSRRRVQQAAVSLGVEKLGRDYVLTDADIKRVRERIGKQGKAK